MVTSVGVPLVAASTPEEEDFDTQGAEIPSLGNAETAENVSDGDDLEAASETVAIDDAVERADGTIEVIVRFEEIDPFAVASSDDPKTALRTHADAAQQGVLEYAERTDGVEVTNQFWLANAALVTLDTDRTEARELAAQPGVTGIHENFAVNVPEPDAFGSSDGDDENVTYGLEQINTTAVWDEFDTRGDGAKIAVLDTGVDVDHPDIELYTDNPNDETYPGGWAEIDGSGDPVPGSTPHDTGFHGTHVSGTVAGGNESGTAIGVAPDANLMHGLVLPDGQGGFAQIVGGMEWAVEEGADVVSMSLGAEGTHPELVEPVRNAEDAGTLVVGAAGNDGHGTTGSPGNVYDALAVGASDEDAAITEFSGGEVIDTDQAWGDEAPDEWPEEYTVPNVAAPGDEVLSAVPEGAIEDDPDAIYGAASGTSMATPHVSGAIALMLSASGGQLSPAEISDALEAHAWKPDGEDDGKDTRYGHGIIDALAATETSAVDSGIVGTVEDVNGDPVADATVSFDGFPTQTDADGEYEVNLAPGDYQVEVDAFAHQPEEATVTVEEDEFTERDFELEPAVESVLVEGQPHGVEAGDSFDVDVYVENLEAYEVSAEGEYPTDDLDVFVDGTEIALDEPETFDEPVSDDVTITVETAENTSGDVSLTHSFSGYDVTETLETGPTGVFDETVAVGVVDDSSSSHGDSLETHLQATAPWFDIDVVDSDDLEAPVDDGAYDVYVVQNFGDADVEWFLEETETPEVGVVLLDQFGEESNAIAQYASEEDNPNAVVNATGSVQQPTVAYHVQDDHPFFEGVAESGDIVDLYTSPAVLLEAGYHATMEGFGSGEYGNVVAADTAITGSFGTTATGTGLAEDQFTRTVWAPSLGHSSYAAAGDSFQPEAYEILANVVEYANDEPVIEPTSPQEKRIDPGATTTVDVETPDLEEVTVDLTEESTLEEDELALSIDGEDVAFGEPVEMTAESLSITAETDANATGSFSLDHSVVTTGEEGSVETTYTTGPTSVYTAPLEVPQDTDSIQHALDLAVDDETIVVDNGTYEEVSEDAPTSWGPPLWIENDGITLKAAENAEPTILYGGDETTVQNGIYVTGDDAHIDGVTINLEDGEAVEGGMHSIVTAEYEGTPTSGLTVSDVTHGGARGVMLADGVSDVTIDGTTAVDASGIAGSYSVYVGDTGTDEVEDSTVFDPELHGLDGLEDVDFEELAAYGLDFHDVDLDAIDADELNAETLSVEALIDHDLETLSADEIAALEGPDADDVEPADSILPRPDPIPITENVHITDAVMEEPSNENAHGVVLRDVQNVTVEDTDVAHDGLRRALFFQTAPDQESTSVEPVTQDIEISNVTAAASPGSDSVIRFRSASGTVEDTTIETGAIGVRQDAGLQVSLSAIDAEIEVRNSSIDVSEEGLLFKHDTTATAERNEIDADTGVHFEGEIDPDDVTVWHNDLSGTDVAVALDGETVGSEPIDARLNYLGEDAPPAVGDVELSPFLPEPPGDEIPDFGDVDAPIVSLQMEANGTYAVGVPGPTDTTLDDVFQSDVEGVAYGFDAESQRWTLLTGDDSLETMQGLMVMPGEDTEAHLQFESGDVPPGPGQTDLHEGWNFVAAPFYGDATDTFEYATSEVTLATHTYDRPTGQLGAPGDLDGTWTAGDEAHVSPFEGYFVFSEGEGTLPAHLSADPDLFQLYDQLEIGDEPEPEGELELDGLEPASVTVEQGETFDAVVITTNTDELPTTETLELRADGELLAFEPVAIEGDDTTFIAFDDVDTSDLEPGEYTYGVFGDSDGATGSLTVEEPPEPAEFAVDDLEPADATIERGETVDVSATVENVGGKSDDQTVELRVNGAPIETQTVDLEPGDSESVTFDGVSTDDLEAGTYVHAVATDDDAATGTLTIVDDSDSAEFAVDDLEPASMTVDQGEAIDVSATVENVGDEAGDESVELRADETVLETESVDLEPDESETVEFENVSTDDLEPAVYVYGVYAGNDESTGSLTVEEPPEPAEFAVDDLEPADAIVQVGDELDVSATVENVGEVAGEQSVELRADETVLETESVDLEANESATVSFENVSTIELEPDEYAHGVYTEDDSATGDLTVLIDEDVVLTPDPDPAGLESTHVWEVTDLDLDGEVLEGWSIDYEGTGTDLSGSSVNDMELSVTRPDGDETTVPIVSGDGDDTSEIRHFAPSGITEETPDGPATFEVPDVVNPEEPGEYNASITFEGDGSAEETFETSFEIDAVDPAEFEVAAVDAPAEIDEDDPFDVSAPVENVGDLEDTQTVEYRIVPDGDDIDDADAFADESITLDLGESQSFDVTDVVPIDAELEPGTYEHGVFTDNDSATETLEIHEVDGMSVGALEFESPADAVANQPFEVSTTVTNLADEPVTDDVELRMAEDADDLADADAIAAEELGLEAGEATALVFEDVVVDDHGFDAGEYALGLFSEASGHAVEIEIHPGAEVGLDIEPGTAGEGAAHTWDIESVDFGDVPMDSITADYVGTGADFSNAYTGDVSVALTDQGDEEPSEAYVNGVEFETETAEIDVGSSFLPVEIEYSTGPAEVVIESLENPDESGEHEASLEFLADDGTALTYTAEFEVDADGTAEVTSIDVTETPADAAG